MRIAQIAPLAESVPPKLYGGTERVVAWLTDELVELGHDVTLFASGDFRTRAKLVPVWPYAFRLGRQRSDPIAVQAVLARNDGEARRRSSTSSTAMSTGCTCRCSPARACLSSRRCTAAWTLRACPSHAPLSRGAVRVDLEQPAPAAARRQLAGHRLSRPSRRLRYTRASIGSDLAFLGRLTKEKGPEAAMRIARAAGMPLRIAAKVPRGERGYFKEQLEPKIDGREVQLTGEVESTRRRSNFWPTPRHCCSRSTGPNRSDS